MTALRDKFAEYITDLQDKIVSALEELDPNAPRFLRDQWERELGGYGISCVFSVPYSATPATTILEKAGVNISVIHGTLPPAAIKQMRVEHASIPYDPDSTTALPFFAAGISLVIHPRNPHAPTVHANYRYFEIVDAVAGPAPGPSNVIAWWFGGGSDLTPSYLYEEDAVHFHSTIKAACDPHGAALHPAFKKWCDEYFFIPHRKEARGLGGLFFDDLCSDPHKRMPDAQAADKTTRPWTPEDIFAFVRSAGDAFIPSYIPIITRRMHLPSTEEERRWQLLRRGRYVEFNLVYDRGTKFGLMTPGARIESILMSLPETARWEYMSEVGTEAESREGQLLEVLKNPKQWV
ncbi:coproporphyrinogen III oxidase [Auriscalpium vulgare]|uniref:Coproporphyrinogen III oxidase n=1 Tax=Auriscalpium vulgare TaxID=40419 RepID=A0ACB8SC10_9AGAM|nr:coproporphyrinogen III oxidase [Auriscalpium vulgare]